MSYSSVILGDSPSSYWQLQETTGTSATDYAGTNTGTYHSGTTLGQQAPPMGGTSVLFNGTSGYMSTVQTIANDSTTFSIELWFNSTAKNVPLAMIANPGQGDAIVGLNSSGNLVGSVANSTESAWNDTTTTGVYNDGKWHYVCYTVASSSASIYVDGALSKTTTGITVDASAGRNNTWALAYNISGSHSYGTYASGYFAHFAVWNTTALTATQVSNHYNAATGGGGGTANNVTLSDSVTTSDTIALVRNRNLSFTDSFTTSDSVVLVQTLHVAFSDSITSSDSITKAVNRVLEFSDAVTSSDSLTNASAHNKSFSDSILSSDTFNKTSDILLNISDSVILSDDTQKSTSHQISLSENISSSDSINNISAHSYDISLTDSVTSSDNILLSQAHAYSLSFSDSVTTSDADERSTSQYINDVIQATDVMNQVRNYLREYTDAISVEDNLVKQLASSLAINDPMTVIDSVTSEKVSVYTINLSDSITIADAITGLNRIFSLAINDNVSFSDSLTTEGGHVLQPLTVNIYLLASLDNKIELLAGASLVAQNDQDFTIEQYSSDTLNFTYSGDLSGCTLEWIMQYKVSSPSPLIKKTMGNGIAITSTSSTSSTFTVSITNEDMATIGRGDYYHQASVVDSLNESNPISKGTVSVLAASNN